MPVLGCFALGLMAKPMLVTAPFVLLLLDYWPLGRWRGAAVEGREARGRGKAIRTAAPPPCRRPLQPPWSSRRFPCSCWLPLPAA